MKLTKGLVTLECQDDFKIQKFYQAEGWIAEDTGLACTPYEPGKIVNLHNCKTWILTHIESGMAIWSAFPPDKRYAHIWLEEIACEELDFTQDRHALKAHIDLIQKKMLIAHKRTVSRWAIVERERLKQQESQVEQLTLFGEVTA